MGARIVGYIDGANFSGANLNGAYLNSFGYNSNFSNANLSYAIWLGMITEEHTSAPNLSGADLTGFSKGEYPINSDEVEIRSAAYDLNMGGIAPAPGAGGDPRADQQ